MGAFHSTQNFGWGVKWNGPFRFGPTGIFGTSLVKVPKCPFPFDSTTLLYPAYKDNNQTRGGLGRCAIGMSRSIAHAKFPKFQTGIARGAGGGGYLG